MRYIKLLFTILDIICRGIAALILAIVYGIVWLVGLTVCIPLVIVLFVPILLLGLFGGYKVFTNQLTDLDEDF